MLMCSICNPEKRTQRWTLTKSYFNSVTYAGLFIDMGSSDELCNFFEFLPVFFDDITWPFIWYFLKSCTGNNYSFLASDSYQNPK